MGWVTKRKEGERYSFFLLRSGLPWLKWENEYDGHTTPPTFYSTLSPPLSLSVSRFLSLHHCFSFLFPSVVRMFVDSPPIALLYSTGFDYEAADGREILDFFENLFYLTNELIKAYFCAQLHTCRILYMPI